MIRPKSKYISKVQSFYDSISPFYLLASMIDAAPKRKGISFSKPQKNDKVLCIGFGLGEEIKHFQKRGCNTYGIELSQGMIRNAKKKNNIKNITRGDTFHLPFKDQSFDIIYSCYLIDIFDKADTITLLKEMRRVTKKGAKIISVNNTFEQGIISKILIQYYLFIKDNMYRRMKTRPIIASDLFRKAGLRDIRRKKVSWGAEAVSGKR
ncbi:MAG: methyltransferase domain-containing protein [Candidatus Aenigmarchaeota archaeon]|nr:methyltransferase domain-containing protein [Candidatus Aenigmarchaeota archaeon]